MNLIREIAKKSSNISNYFVIISYFAFSFVVLSTMLDVFLRYFFSKPIMGVIELNQCMMPVMVFMAIGLTQQKKGHISVTILLNRIKAKYRIFLELGAYILAFGFSVLFGWETWLDAMKAFKINDSVLIGIKEMPIWWSKFSIPFGFWVLALQCSIDFIANIKPVKQSGNPAA